MKNNEYIGKEIRSDLKRNKKGKIIETQRIDVQCSICKQIKNVNYHSHKLNRIKNGSEYRCIKCVGRKKCKENSNNQKGKTYEELYGKKKSNHIKSKLRDYNLNEKDYSKVNYKTGFTSPKRGKTYEELYGIENSKRKRELLSEQNKGKNNPMYGKPSPTGSGNGWSGWYKGWYFRSIKELSFMVNYIEKNNLSWKSAETKEYAIPYIDDNGNDRTYFADFVLDNIVVEVKPKRLCNSVLVKLKESAATDWCICRNMEYKIFTEDMFDVLNKDDIIRLYDSNSIKWTKRYKEKYNAYCSIRCK